MIQFCGRFRFSGSNRPSLVTHLPSHESGSLVPPGKTYSTGNNLSYKLRCCAQLARKCRGDEVVIGGSTNEEFADSPCGPTVTSPSPPPLLFVSPPALPVRRKKRSRPSSFHEPSSQPPSGETTTMTLPAVTCEWPSRALCRPIARDTWTPLGLSPSPPPRGHPKGILDIASISRGKESRLTPSRRPSCYGHSAIDLKMDAKNDALFFV